MRQAPFSPTRPVQVILPEIDPSWSDDQQRRVREIPLLFDAFLPALETRIDAALAELADASLLVLDLRHNGGGNLHMARRLQARFLHTDTALGTLRSSDPSGGLGPVVPLRNGPAEPGWRGRLRVLTSFLLGLQAQTYAR